jgi:hypothetical protein
MEQMADMGVLPPLRFHTDKYGQARIETVEGFILRRSLRYNNKESSARTKRSKHLRGFSGGDEYDNPMKSRRLNRKD